MRGRCLFACIWVAGLVTAAAAESTKTLFMSPHFRPVVATERYVFVANTAGDSVDVIDPASGRVVRRIPVGVDPVGLALRPDGRELWVANHVSDSVSVIDLRPNSPTAFAVVDTVQLVDMDRRVTLFDEPVGIAFAGTDKAYVALSSQNEVAVVDVATRKVIKRLRLKAQDPRALAVHDRWLFVIPFESHNQTQLSGGAASEIDGKLVTFDAWEHSIRVNNVLSLGHVVDIVRHPDVPDRDLFIFDTETDELVGVLEGLGTLLYGIAVGPDGAIYVAQTEARNDANGRAGTAKHGLAELENRPFLNRVTKVVFPEGPNRPDAAQVEFFELEPLPPRHPEPDRTLATPYAIESAPDGRFLALVAAASHRLATLDPATGQIIGLTDVDPVPRSIAFRKTAQGLEAWVLCVGSNTVVMVELTDPARPVVTRRIHLDDPTPDWLRRGRIAFESAEASTTRTFSCASCHPDGHTDQLLWVLDTPIVTGGDQIMPRSTMPIRGLRDTEPYHWDGIPGDPYGGIHSASLDQPQPPRCDSPLSCARDLVDGSLATTMKDVTDPARNDEGKPGYLTAEERDALAKFILSIPYPPSRGRPFDDVVSERARRGFVLFHVEGDLDPTKVRPNVCGDCHRFPFLVSTNTPGTGMDAPTWRGAYDRWLILPQGRLNIIAFPFFRSIAEEGFPEREIWRLSWAGRRRFDPVWDMVLEMSTGFSGAFARQVTLNQRTATAADTEQLLAILEEAAEAGAVQLVGHGVRVEQGDAAAVEVRYEDGTYRTVSGRSWTSTELLEDAREGRLVLTLTAKMGTAYSYETPQPALWTVGPIHEQRGRQKFPVIGGQYRTLLYSGRHIHPDAAVFVDGRRVEGTVELGPAERVRITLQEVPEPGWHLLQLMNPGGLFSNEILFLVDPAEAAPAADLEDLLQRRGWDDIVGHWISSDGQTEVQFQWKVRPFVLETIYRDANNESFAWLTLDPETQDVVHWGFDRNGALFRGRWHFEGRRQALLFLNGRDGQGRPFGFTVLYRLDGEDELTLIVDVGQPIELRFQRQR